MELTINGIQQIGIGVRNAKEVFNWYRQYLGFDILVFEDDSTASLMTRYTANKAEDRIAFLALNMRGGGGLEIWQFKNKVPQPPKQEIALGDLGVNLMKLRTKSVAKSHQKLKNLNLPFLTSLNEDPNETSHFFFKDPWSNLVQMVEDEYCFSNTKLSNGGVMGVVLGVSDMDASIHFYKNLLGFDKIVYDKSEVFDDFMELPKGRDSLRRVLLHRSNKKIGGFGELLGPCEIELMQNLEGSSQKIYKNRLWGDLGYIHVCFDVRGMDALREDAKMMGHAFTVDSADSFDMGDAAGHFSYVEDPDGTLLEFVETHKVPIIKKLGIFINMKIRSVIKPLPRWLVKAMRIHRVKKDI